VLFFSSSLSLYRYERDTIRDQLDIIIASDELTVSLVIASLPPIDTDSSILSPTSLAQDETSVSSVISSALPSVDDVHESFRSPLPSQPTDAASLIASLTTPVDGEATSAPFDIPSSTNIGADIEMEGEEPLTSGASDVTPQIAVQVQADTSECKSSSEAVDVIAAGVSDTANDPIVKEKKPADAACSDAPIIEIAHVIAPAVEVAVEKVIEEVEEIPTQVVDNIKTKPKTSSSSNSLESRDVVTRCDSVDTSQDSRDNGHSGGVKYEQSTEKADDLLAPDVVANGRSSSSPLRSGGLRKAESDKEKESREKERKQREREAEELEELRRKLAVYKKLHPMSEDEMNWKQNVLDSSINTFVVAESEEEKAQRLYTETMVESDKHGMLLRLLKNHPALRLLGEYKSAEPNGASSRADKDTSFAPPAGGKGGLMAALAGRGNGGDGGGGKGGLMAALAGRGNGGDGGGGKGGLMAALAGRGNGGDGGGGKGGLMAALAGRGNGGDGGGGKGGLMAALAGRGNGGDGGGGKGGGLMAALAGRGNGGDGGGGKGGGLMAALAGRGNGGGLAGGGLGGGLRSSGKAVGMLRKKVEKELVKAEAEIESRKSRGGYSPEQSIICDALKAVLDVPGHGDVDDGSSAGYAARVKQVALEWLKKLESAQHRAGEEESRCQSALTTLSEEVEKWARRKLEAPNKDEVEREREKQWAIDNQEDNEKALQVMRSFMPPDLPVLTIEELDARVASAHGSFEHFYTPQLIERLKSKKLLQWVVTHPDDIVRANFLMGAHKQSFEQLQEYDLTELRAVYAVLPTVNMNMCHA
jgi:hypothetical protein